MTGRLCRIIHGMYLTNVLNTNSQEIKIDLPAVRLYECQERAAQIRVVNATGTDR
jgi:hypothetical protein